MEHPAVPSPERAFRAVRSLDALPQAALTLTQDGQVVDINDLASSMLGSDAGPPRAKEIGRQLNGIESLARWLAEEERDTVFHARVELRRTNGVPVTLDLAARRQHGDGREQVLCLLSQLSEDRLTGEAQRYFDIAFETAPIGMALFNTDGQYIRVNSSLCEMLGRTPGELLGRRDQEFTHPEDGQADVDAAWRILNGELDTWQCEKRFIRPDGREVWTIANLTFLRSADGHPLSWVGQFQDVTKSKTQARQLRELADRDPLTGLFNRRCFEERLRTVVDAGEEGAVLVADLDALKEINDAYGHHAGDQVLVGIATALRKSLRRDDLIARIGGDEFACVLRGAGKQMADELATFVGEAIANQRFDFDSAAAVSASIGIATFGPHESLPPRELLARADDAMYRAKRARLHAAGPSREEGRSAGATGGRPPRVDGDHPNTSHARAS